MITITIKTDNAAFQDDRSDEVARILRVLADQIQRHEPIGRPRDLNGNVVGSVTLTGKDRT